MSTTHGLPIPSAVWTAPENAPLSVSGWGSAGEAAERSQHQRPPAPPAPLVARPRDITSHTQTPAAPRVDGTHWPKARVMQAARQASGVRYTL